MSGRMFCSEEGEEGPQLSVASDIIDVPSGSWEQVEIAPRSGCWLQEPMRMFLDNKDL